MERRRQVAGAGGLFGIGAAAEQFQRLGLGSSGEGHIGDAGTSGASARGTSAHLSGKHVIHRHLTPIGEFGKFGGGEHLAQLEGGIAGLGAVGLIGDHREALAAGGTELLLW